MTEKEEQTELIEQSENDAKVVVEDDKEEVVVAVVESRGKAYDYYWQYGRAHACEFVTAMILVFNVTSVFAYASSDDVLPLVPGLVAGFSIFALLQMFHYVSVAHVSPTVTFGFAITGNFDWRLVPSYVLCQLLGAMTGAVLVKYSAGQGEVLGAVVLADLTKTQVVGLFIAEMQTSFILQLATNLVVGNKKWDNPNGAFMIGMCVFTGIMAGHHCGAGQMHPAKVLATAILTGQYAYVWVYWVASAAAAVQTYLIFGSFFAEKENLICKHLKDE
jgi:glycerol uptake facilitator-like aquaporin